LSLLVREHALPAALLLVIDAERNGAGTEMPLIDWLIHRGHITEEQIASALAYCLRLSPLDPAPELVTRAKIKPTGSPWANRTNLSRQPNAGVKGTARPARPARHSLRVVK